MIIHEGRKIMKYTTVLFDLDGTLVDSGIGVTNGAAYAIKKLGMTPPPRQELFKFIGPPLPCSFRDFCGFDNETTDLAVDYFREYYAEKGILECTMYEGILELMDSLKKKGYKLGLATSKPEIFASQIAEHFGFDCWFDLIAGSTLDGSRVKKHDVIEYALRRFGISEREECVMIGDRLHDIEGAKASGMKSIGVLWGYGSREELEAAGADLICESVNELFDVIIGL